MENSAHFTTFEYQMTVICQNERYPISFETSLNLSTVGDCTPYIIEEMGKKYAIKLTRGSYSVTNFEQKIKYLK